MSGKIEICPFCGVTPEPFSYPRHAPVEVTCNDEDCPAFNIVVSVEDWNRRAARVEVYLPNPLEDAGDIQSMLNSIGRLEQIAYWDAKAIWNACLDKVKELSTIHVGELDPAQRLALARGEL